MITMTKTTNQTAKVVTPISLLNEVNNVLTNFRTYQGMDVYEL